MKHPQTACDPRRIEQCLVDALAESEREAFEAHLDSCDACRAALESRAADAADWSAAREFLSSHDRPLSESELIGAETDAAGIEAVLAALGPTDDPRMLGRLGAYEIAGVVGRGGMGVVLKGFDAAESIRRDQSSRAASCDERSSTPAIRTRGAGCSFRRP